MNDEEAKPDLKSEMTENTQHAYAFTFYQPSPGLNLVTPNLSLLIEQMAKGMTNQRLVHGSHLLHARLFH